MPSLVKIDPVVLEKKISKISLMYCRYFVIISPWKKGPSFKQLDSPSPKDALCQVWLKLASGFGEEAFLNFVIVFSLLCSYLPLKKGGALHLNFESPLHKDALCQVWSSGFGEDFLNFVNVFSLFRNYLPLEKRPFI